MKFLLKHKKYLLGFIAIALIVTSIGVAQGQTTSLQEGLERNNCGFSELGCAIQNIILAFFAAWQTLLKALILIAAFLVDWMLRFSANIIHLATVKAGFQITLSLVNIMFVIAIIIIAFQIILQYKEGEAKKMIGRLILAAVLVNFSFLIAGLLLDASNVFTNFFLGELTPERLHKAFSIDAFLNMNLNLGGIQLGTLSSFLIILPVAFFSILIMTTILLALVAVFLMVLLRNVEVAVLLITMPIIWALWVFPSGGMAHQYATKWWKEFLNKGVIYIPIVTFFLWLAVSTVQLIGADAGQFSSPIQGQLASQAGIGSVISSLFGTIIQLFLLIGLIIAGLKEAAEAGIAGAKWGVETTKGYQKRFAQKAGRRAYKYTGARGVTGGISKALTSKFNPLTYIPGVAGLAQTGAGKLREAQTTSLEADIEKEKKKYDSLSKDQRASVKATTDAARAGKIRSLKGKGELSKFARKNPEEMKNLISGSDKPILKYISGGGKQYLKKDTVKEIADADPRLVPHLYKPEDGETSLEQITNYTIKLSQTKAGELNPDILEIKTPEGKALVDGLLQSKAALRGVFMGPQAIQNKLEKVIEKQINTNPTARTDYDGFVKTIKQLDTSIADAVARGDTASATRFRASKDTYKKDFEISTNALDKATQHALKAEEYMEQLTTGYTKLKQF